MEKSYGVHIGCCFVAHRAYPPPTVAQLLSGSKSHCKLASEHGATEDRQGLGSGTVLGRMRRDGDGAQLVERLLCYVN